jgi:hypothetical protein
VIGEQPLHFAVDVLRVAEWVAALGNANGPDPPGPRIHILEQMPVNGPIMPVAQAARRNVLVGTRAGNFLLEGIEPGLVAQPEAILEDGRARITVWVCDCGIPDRRRWPFR